MTNCSKFRVGNIGYACYFAVGAWLSNFGRSFSYPLGTFSSKIESLRQWGNVLRIGEEGERKNGGVGRNIGNCYKLSHGRPGFLDLF